MIRAGARPVAAAVLLLAVATFHGVFIARTAFEAEGRSCFSLFDDAMISMRYARNLAEGEGLRWNPGETPVEGYTNFLWTVAMAGAHLVPVPESKISLVVMLMGSVVLLGATAAAWRLAARLSPGSLAVPIAAGALTGFYYPLAFWTLRGLETGLQTLLLLAGTIFAVRLHAGDDARARSGLAVVTALLLLVRPDGAVPVAILLAGVALGTPPGRRRSAVAPALITGVVVAALHTLGRMAYYGDPLPNTYYLKATGIPLGERIDRGAFSLFELVRLHLYPLLVVLAAGALLLRGRSRFAPALLGALLAGQCAYSVLVGGDAWEWMDYSNRFIAPAVPAGFVAAAWAAGTAARRAGRAAGVVMLLVAALLLGATNAGPVRLWWRDGAFHATDDAEMARLGVALRRATDESVVPAVVWAGGVPYFAHRTCVDLLGKNDPVIAKGPTRGPFVPGHDKWDYRHSIGELRPDIVFQTSFVWTEPGFYAFLDAHDYERLPNDVWVLRDASGIDRDALAALPRPSR